jgi:vancomycin resistance protein YoaR
LLKTKKIAILKIAILLIITSMLSGCNSIEKIVESEEGKEQEKIQQEKTLEQRVKQGVVLGKEQVGNLEKSSVLHKIEMHSVKINIDKIDASMNNETWEVYPEKAGKKINVAKTLESVMNAKEGEKVDYIIEEVSPDITSESLKKNIVSIASHSTPLLDRSNSRIKNIKVASKKINGKVLSPGEEFSFNKVVGQRTEQKGYEFAPIIINTEEGPEKGYGVGGGVCQVSTTIYNAVEECNLEILERHIHSKNVGYVPKGEDATVSYGSIDFRFRNNRKHPIKIQIIVDKKNLTVKILENRN